jgi:hypothetical protein
LVARLFRTKWRLNSPFSVNPTFRERIRITDFLEKTPLHLRAFARGCIHGHGSPAKGLFVKKVIIQSRETLSVIQIIFFSCTSTF